MEEYSIISSAKSPEGKKMMCLILLGCVLIAPKAFSCCLLEDGHISELLEYS